MRVSPPQPNQHPTNEWCTGSAPLQQLETPPLYQLDQQQLVILSAHTSEDTDCAMEETDLPVDVVGDDAAHVRFGAAEPAVEPRALDGSRVARLREGVELEGAVLVRRQRKESNKQLLTIGPRDAAPSYIGQVCMSQSHITISKGRDAL